MSDGRLLNGARYDEQRDATIVYTEQMMDKTDADAVVGNMRTEVIPNDRDSSKVRVWSGASIPTLDSYFKGFPGVVSFELPAVLTAITTTFNKNSGSGVSIHAVGDAAWVGESGGLNLDPTSSTNSSAAIIPDIQPIISTVDSSRVPVTNYVFYSASDIVTLAAIITRIQNALTIATIGIAAGIATVASHSFSINQPIKFATLVGASGGLAAGTLYYVTAISSTTVSFSVTRGGSPNASHAATSGTLYPVVASWPKFHVTSAVFTLKGQQTSISQQADSHIQYRWNSAGDVSYAISPIGGMSPTRSDGNSIEIGVTVRTIQIPPTIHGAITVSSTSDTATVTTTVKANVPAIVGVGSAPSVSAITNEPSSISATVTGSLTPTSLSATAGDSAIPTAGLFILDIDGQPFAYGYSGIRVSVVDFSYFA